MRTFAGHDARGQSLEAIAAEDEYFIEQRPGGRYNVSKLASDRASAVTDTQAEAIAKAKQMNPEATVHVERVRDVGQGRDKWCKI